MTHPSRPNPAFHAGLDGIGWIVFDDPQRELNILTRPVMEELARCLVEARALGESGELKVLVIWSGKSSTFLAGADVGDILEITDPAQGEMGCRLGQEIFQALEDLPLLSLAAIHGVCLGGGVELALACTRRIASDAEETRLGFPELLLGILPAWGGTTRLPRLIGLREASKMILSGKRYSARQALAAGLLDEVLPAQGFRALALEYAHGMVTGPFGADARRPRTPSLPDRSALGRRIVLGIARRQVLARTHGHYPGPEKVLDVMRTSWDLPLSEALATEARAAGGLIASPVSKNLIHLFYLREDARKGNGIPEAVLALPRQPTMTLPPDGREEGMVHRILESYLAEARVLLKEGFGKRRIDAVARGFGMESGPFDLMKSRNPPGRRYRDPPGRQSDPEIRDRLIFAMALEATSVLEEGEVSRAGQVDLALIIGAGFPPFRGGLLRYIDHLGLPVLAARLREFAHGHGARFEPPPLLLELARSGGTFYTRFP